VPDAGHDGRTDETTNHQARKVSGAQDADFELRKVVGVGTQWQQGHRQAIAHQQYRGAKKQRGDRPHQAREFPSDHELLGSVESPGKDSPLCGGTAFCAAQGYAARDDEISAKNC
jgi:hypothetical protein